MKEFGILNNPLDDNPHSNDIFTDEKRSIGAVHHREREWTESIGSKRQWWTHRYLPLVTKRVL